MGAHLPWLHFCLLRVVQNVETYAYTTAAIHTQGKKAYSNATPYRACFSARLPGCCNTDVGMGWVRRCLLCPSSPPPPLHLDFHEQHGAAWRHITSHGQW
jgi:hypothetical protein